MQRILTAQASEGMVLAQEVRTPEGRILCGKGTALSTSLIDRLRQMEVATLIVEGHPVAVEGERTLAEELREIERRFSRVTDTPPLMYLKKRIMEKTVRSRSQR